MSLNFLVTKLQKIIYIGIMNIKSLAWFIYLTVFVITLMTPQKSIISDVDLHLEKYSAHETKHHENIDDETHSHRHKHSKNGDEHEHNHEHSKTSQMEIKLLNHFIAILAENKKTVSSSGFVEKNLFSTAHPSSIYRPPIFI
jgi:ABC-type nickel/cobalt efflux system permease component RcnA